MRIMLVAMASLASLWVSAARAETFESLESKSIVYVYHERMSYPSGNLADVTWTGKVYVAPDARVFLRHHSAAHFGANASEVSQYGFDSESDRNGNGDGRHANYAWNGSGFTRSWDEKGVQTTEVISIQDGRCQSTVERTPFTGTMISRSGSCRIVAGNALHR